MRVPSIPGYSIQAQINVYIPLLVTPAARTAAFIYTPVSSHSRSCVITRWPPASIGSAKPAEADVTREHAGFTVFRLIIHITSIWPGSQAHPIKNPQIDSSSYIGCTLSGLKSPQGPDSGVRVSLRAGDCIAPHFDFSIYACSPDLQ